MASSDDFCLSSLLEANLDDNDELELAEYVLWVYMLGLPEDSSRAPMILQTEFDYLRCFCEDESGNDCCLPFIMIDRVMQNQSFLQKICQRTQQRIVEIEELYAIQNSPSPSSAGMETDPPTSAPKRTQTVNSPAPTLNSTSTVSSSNSSSMLVSPAVFASLVVFGCVMFIVGLTYYIYYKVQQYDRKQREKLEEQNNLERMFTGDRLTRTMSYLARAKEVDESNQKKVTFEHLESVIFRQNDLRDAYESASGYSTSGSDDDVSSSTGDGCLSSYSGGGSACSGENFRSLPSPYSLPNSHKIYASSNNQNIEVGAGPKCKAESDDLFKAGAPQLA